MKKLLSIILILSIICTNVYAGTYMFSDKPSKISRWLAVKGYGGSVYDALNGYFSSLSGLSNGTLYDHVNATLVNLGYTGTMEDKLATFFVTTTSIGNPRDAERAFWDNDSYSFGVNGVNNALVYNSSNLVYNSSYLVYNAS